MAKGFTGKHHTEKVKKQISKSVSTVLLGHDVSEETRDKLREKRKGWSNPSKGKKRPQTSKEKHPNWKGGQIEGKKKNKKENRKTCWKTKTRSM